MGTPSCGSDRTFKFLKATEKRSAIHPGEILREELMEPLGLSQNALARALGVSPRRINQIVNEQRAITTDTAMRLARFFETSPEVLDGSSNRL